MIFPFLTVNAITENSRPRDATTAPAAPAHGGSAGGLNRSSPAFTTALQACRKLLPNGGAEIGGTANGAQQQSQALQFAGCMRAHGITDFPHRSPDGAFNLPSDINQQAPQFKSAEQACANVQPDNQSINQGRR